MAAASPVAWRTIVDHRDAQPTTRLRNTLAAAGVTLLDSGRLLASRAVGRLSEDRLHYGVHVWADHVMRVAGASVEVTGEDNVPAGRCVLLSNHTSLMDPAVMVLAFPRRLSFVAKQELAAVPLFGSVMDMFGVVFVDRSRPRVAVAQLASAGDRLPTDRAIWIAVEGRRSPDGTLGRFKKGGFHLALQWQVPILPTFIAGTRSIIAAEQWKATTGQRCRVAFGPPIATEGATVADLRRLLTETRSAIEGLAEVCGPG